LKVRLNEPAVGKLDLAVSGTIVRDSSQAEFAVPGVAVAPIPITAVPEGLADNMRRQAVAAYRIADDAAALVWQRRVREQETGLMASINLADLTALIHADGRYRARAAYNIRRQGRPITLLPLQKTSAGDFSSKVVVIYSGHLGEPLHRWTQVRPPAPQILSEVPVSRTLWTVLLPRQYEVSVVKGESNLEAVAAAYQQEERKLSFLDELRQMLQVASTKGKSAARTKARDNLKQAGAALYRGWPWLAAVTGMAWLFLLPAGVFGLALLVTALCVLIARLRKRQTTGSNISKVEQGIS